MKNLFPANYSVIIVLLLCGLTSFQPKVKDRKIFDVHIHGNRSFSEQLKALESAGVYRACISTSWSLQEEYRHARNITLGFGLMLPCPNGKVPYSLQKCYEDGREYPDIAWVEKQIQQGKINFLGEVLSQYYGISSSDSSLFSYYRLALKYDLPVGIHTGSAGPDHGCPNFSEAMGNPELLRGLLTRFPGLRVWIMHAGAPYVKETIRIMKEFPNVYTDISAINFPPILPQSGFESVMKELISEGLEDRVMFGSDNNDISTVINSIERMESFSNSQKEKIFFQNAENFFGHRNAKRER